jgi:lysine 2,3-aminomutase
MNMDMLRTGSRTKSAFPTAFHQRDPNLPLLRQNVAEKDWNDWRWQMRNRIRDIDDLKPYLPRLAHAGELKTVTARFPLAITPYYLGLIEDGDPLDPVLLMSVPRSEELDNPLGLPDDPLDEESDMPTPGLTHRYPDRALIVISEICPMYCRHCTRKRFVGVEESAITPERLKNYLDYIGRHPEIKDVIISGGDPLSLPDKIIERVLAGLRAIPTVEIIRIGSRIPVLMPQRITPEFCEMIQRYHPVWINTHFNHPNEVTPEAALACDRLLRAGVPMNNQSVLLRGVNDDPELMVRLCRALFRIRVRPYYLYQCDLSRGVEHFRTPISRGIEIMEYLRGRLGGLAIPQYIVDAPHGGGKIPVGPNYIVSVSPTHTVLRNFEGLMVSYPEPVAGPVTSPIAAWCGLPTPTWENSSDSVDPSIAASGEGSCPAAAAESESEPAEGPVQRGGVAALASGQLDCLVPEGSDRMDRRRMIDHSRSPRFKPEEYQQKRLLAEIGEIVSKVNLSEEAPRAEGEQDPLPFPSSEDASGRRGRWQGGMEAVD